MPQRTFEFNNKSRNRRNPELDHIFPIHLKGRNAKYRSDVDIVWNMQPVTGITNNLKSNHHPKAFFSDTVVNRNEEIIHGSKYFDQYDFIPSIDDERWNDHEKFIEFRREKMIYFLKTQYGIELELIQEDAEEAESNVFQIDNSEIEETAGEY